uniref:hypothetical protein n=1 Tax=Stagonosporopsis vannaccii TaxID=2606854 RepID=UPI002411249D
FPVLQKNLILSSLLINSNKFTLNFRPPLLANLLISSPPFQPGNIPGFSGIYKTWRYPGMSTQESIVHAQALLDYHNDRLDTNLGSKYNEGQVRHYIRLLRSLKAQRANELAMVRTNELAMERVSHQPLTQQPQPLTQQSQPLTQQSQPLTQQSQPLTRPITIQSLLNEESIILMTTIPSSVSLFIRNTLMYLRLIFSGIIPLALLALVLQYFPLIIEVYTMLNNILAEHFMFAIGMLFSILYFLLKLLLVIRRANNSSDLYDKFFNFTANHYWSVILYFFILLLSVGLVYFCICDCNSVCDSNCVCDSYCVCDSNCVCDSYCVCDSNCVVMHLELDDSIFKDSAVSYNSYFCFIALYKKYNIHLQNNKIPSENFLTWLIDFVEREGFFIVNNRRDLTFVITQATIDKQILEFIQEILGFGKVIAQSAIISRYVTQKEIKQSLRMNK